MEPLTLAELRELEASCLPRSVDNVNWNTTLRAVRELIAQHELAEQMELDEETDVLVARAALALKNQGMTKRELARLRRIWLYVRSLTDAEVRRRLELRLADLLVDRIHQAGVQ